MKTKEQLIEEFILENKKNKDSISKHVAIYDNNPIEMRNKLAEWGMETTPSELKTLIDILRLVVND